MLLTILKKNIEEDLKIEQISANCYTSTSALYKMFSAVFDTTIKDYIRKRRLSLSAYDLVYTDMSILEIAIKFKYGSYESYSRAFKKLFGKSPSSYRKNAQYIEFFPGVQLFEHQTVQTLEGKSMSIEKHMNRDKLEKAVSSVQIGYVLDVDIDKFQKINDNYGYDVGNKVLVEVPTRLENTLRLNEIGSEVIRINNDEFAIVIKDVEKTKIETLARKLVEAMAEPIQIESGTLSVSVSIGIAAFELQRDSADIVDHANFAMYEAKKSGRNTYKFYSE